VGLRKADILSVLREAGSKGLKAKDIAHQVRAGSKDLKTLRSLLQDLEMEGTIIRGRRRRYQLPDEAGFIRGTVYGYGSKLAILVPDGDTRRLRISSENIGGAHHGDTVLAKVIRGEHGDREARIVKILEYAGADVVGQISGRKGAEHIHVNRDHRHKSVSVSKDAEAKTGDYVMVRVPRWGQPYEKTRGRITEVLGGRFTPGEDFAAIVREFNLPVAFPKAVLDEAEAIPADIPAEELLRREDLSDLTVFTIDPEDAKDFDDAISIEHAGRGRMRVGIHIADVSHYVAQGSALDNEAMARGMSIYLVGRAIPMLPDRLSADMASLKPGVQRLAVSVFLEMDKHANVLSYDIKESVVLSKARLTYDEAQRLLDKGAGWRASKDMKRVAEALDRVDGLRQLLKEKRIKRGAVELDTPEVDIVLDSSGNAVDVRPTSRLNSHNLIEELMILANETIAEHMSYLGREFIYRIHEVPDLDDMAELSDFAGTFGHRFRWTKGTSPRTLQSLLEKVKGRPEHYVISIFLLRSLKKALYSERNVGHFGLASKCYTHFTSPIRRYPDLVVHRLLKRYGLYKSAPEDRGAILKFVKQAADIASMREIEGDEAERASIKARIAEFMEGKIGEEYWGIISGVKGFGFWVMLEENLVEGLVHVSRLGDDYYTVDPTGIMLIGARKGRVYRMGDRVKVKVTRVDRHKREIDFDIVDVEIREDRGIVVAEDERREKRRRFLEYAAEARKVRPAKRGPSAAGEKAKGRGRPRKRRRSASSGKPQSPRRKTGGRSGGKHKPAGQAGPKKPSASGRRRKPRRGPRGGPKRSRKSGV
jgi:ribonuclease R